MTDKAAGRKPETGRLVGEDPKPRVLLAWQGAVRDRMAEVLGLHAPTVRLIDTLAGVRQDDYDVLVTDCMTDLIGYAPPGTVREPEDHLFVMSFAAPPDGDLPWGKADQSTQGRGTGIEWRTGFLSKSVYLPDNVLPAARDLVHDDLLPVARARESHIHFSTMRPSGTKVLTQSGAIDVVDPRQQPTLRPDAFVIRSFLRTGGANAKSLGGWYRRSDDSEGWVLPSDVRRPWDWAAAAIRHWAITYRRFPLVGGWWEDRRWQTVAETRATETRARLKQQLVARQATFARFTISRSPLS